RPAGDDEAARARRPAGARHARGGGDPRGGSRARGSLGREGRGRDRARPDGGRGRGSAGRVRRRAPDDPADEGLARRPRPLGRPDPVTDPRVTGFVDAHTHLYAGLVPYGLPNPEPPPQNFVEILERVWWRLDRALDAAMLAAAARAYLLQAR